VLDLVSGGRLDVTVGGGYREQEYAQFGLELRRRPSLMERGVETLKKAWTGVPFQYEGQTVQILPRPVQSPRPRILMGGSSTAAAERAARIADGYRPTSAALYEDYRLAMKALGKPAPEPMGKRVDYVFLHVTETPKADWVLIAPHALHENNDYASWLKGSSAATYEHADSAQALLDAGRYKIVTPAECIEMARRDGVLSFKPLMGGLEPILAWKSLRLFEDEVLPHIVPTGKGTTQSADG